MTADDLFWIAPIGSALGLIFAYVFYRQIMKKAEGEPDMIRIAGYVREGAMAYLKQQYKVVAIFFVCAGLGFGVLALLNMQSKWVPFAFFTGGFFSGLSGFIGMKTSTSAASRTTFAAKQSLNQGLNVAFRAGAVMGLTVVGLGLLDISIWFIVLRKLMGYNLHVVTTTMLCFGMGASSQALFARVGGGIFTKAADVGADLVGKIEAGIPEDDPRNPATIADNVGDNVGDVAGMGADLYESYCGSILATAALGVAAGLGIKGVIAPMLLAAAGIVVSIVGIYLVRTRGQETQKQLLKALGRGINTSSWLVVIVSFLTVWLLMPNHFGVFFAVVIGLAVGTIIGKSTEYFTSNVYGPTRHVAMQGKTGPATVIIEGLGTGMLSTIIPVLAVGTGTLAAYAATGGFSNMAMGLYGVGIAAVGMLSTLGITLASDAYGPVADNAGGNAEMTGQPDFVRKRTDALDSLGNTTAATGKGFAIGSAALTALALLASYVEEIRAGLHRLGQESLTLMHGQVPLMSATIENFMDHYQVHLMNPRVLVGLFLGAMLALAFCGMTLKAVGRAAGKMVEEVRRQFRQIKGILEGKAVPDYTRCIQIATKAAQREMILPSLMAIIAPIAVGLILGVPGVMGLLAGALCAGFAIAIFMANAGGAWDNAKKFVEEGHLGGKGSDTHKATIIGDTVGDPFKDTSGPSLNILIKLMSMVSIVVAGLIVKYHIF